MIQDAKAALVEGEKMQLAYNIRNVHRAVGTRLSAHITAALRHGPAAARPITGAPARLGRVGLFGSRA